MDYKTFPNFKLLKYFFISCFLIFLSSNLFSQCGPATPTFTVDLSGNVDSAWISPGTSRVDTCCGATAPDKCVAFNLTLDSSASGIIFNICDGAVPNGAIFYQVSCGSSSAVGEPLCLSGPGPHYITFCKPGNNTNKYCITSIPKPNAGPDLAVNDGCMDTLNAIGYDDTTIVWTSVFPGARGNYDTSLTCTQDCPQTIVNGGNNYPTFIDFEVCGKPVGGCLPTPTCDTVRVFFYTTLEVEISPKNPTVCFGQAGTWIKANPAGGNPPYLYNWSTNETTDSIFVGVGSYIVELVDGSGCPPTFDTIVVTDFTNPIRAFAGPDQIVCKQFLPISLNGTVQAASGGMWSGGSGTYNPNDTTLNANYSPSLSELTSGSATLYLTTTGNGTCPVDIDTLTIDLKEFNANITASKTNVSCKSGNDGTANVNVTNGSPPYTYQWDTTANSQTTSTISNLETGTYIVTVTDSNGCSDTLSVFIDEPTVLIASISAITNVSCNGGNDGTAIASGQGGILPYTYSWPSGKSKAIETGLSAGSYQVTVSDQNGCTSIVVATINEPDSITIGGNITPISCFSGSDGMIMAIIQGGTRPYTYQWTTNSSDSAISALSASNYGLTLTDANGCQVDTVFSIIEPQAIVVSTSASDTICIGNNFNLSVSASGGNGNYTYNWNMGLGGGSTKSVNPMTTTTYTVNTTDSKGCTAEPDSVTVYVRDLNSDILIAQKQGDICLGDSTTVFATHDGKLGPYTYTWNTLDNGLGPFTVSPQSTQNYIINVTDRCGITISDTVQVRVNNYPLIALPDTIDLGCAPLTVSFTDSLNQNTQGLNYNWDFGDGSNSSINPTSHTYPNAGTYQITLSVTNQAGCESNSSSGGIIYVTPSPIANFIANPQVADISNPQITFTNTSSGENRFYWNFGLDDKVDSINNEVLINFPDTGTYPVKLIVTNSFGCLDSIMKQIIINPVFEFKIPNAFSPNPNGSNGGIFDPRATNNDIFFAFADYVKEFHMMIFNRWGELIFESFDINVGWDGYYRNKLSQQDVYVYKVEITWIDGSKLMKAGDVTLFR